MANKDRHAVESGLNDLLGNVIQSDRQRAGRGHESTPAPPQEADDTPRTETSTPYDAMTENSVISEEAAPASRQAERSPARKPTNSRRPPRPETAPPPSPLAARRDEARSLRETSTTTVTLRIPQALNDWLDEYVHRSWPTRIRKQELVTEALQMLYARRGRAGEEIMETELLTEKETP